MLNLQPLIARLVDDVLCAIGDATLAELGALAGRSDATGVQPALPPRRRDRRHRDAKVVKPSFPVGSRSYAGGTNGATARDTTTPEPAGVDDITDPDLLLAPLLLPVMTEQLLLPAQAVGGTPRSKPDDEAPPGRARHVSPQRTLLRAGESIARASAAGVVIRRAKRAST